MKRIEKMAQEHQDQVHVCMALWEAGFAGPESAERGAIMMAAKGKVSDAFEAGFRAAREMAAGLFDDYIVEARGLENAIRSLGEEEVRDGEA